MRVSQEKIHQGAQAALAVLIEDGLDANASDIVDVDVDQLLEAADRLRKDNAETLAGLTVDEVFDLIEVVRGHAGPIDYSGATPSELADAAEANADALEAAATNAAQKSQLQDQLLQAVAAASRGVLMGVLFAKQATLGA